MSKRLQHQFDRGDIVSLDMSSTSSHAVCKALVLSPAEFNALGLALVAPVTEYDSRRYSGFAVEIGLEGVVAERGAALVNLVRPVDLIARRAKLLGTVPQKTIDEAIQRMQALLGKH